MTDLSSFINTTFNLQPNNIDLYRQALTHRSYLNEVHDKKIHSYERLEFLGDAVLSFCVSKIIYQKYPLLPEGNMTNLRSSVVKTESLAMLSQKLNLGSYLYLSKGEEESGGRNSNSILADCFEATLAAIYLDQGIETASNVVNKYISPLIEEGFQKKELKDYKSLLQEISQEKYQISPVYKVISAIGPDHKKIFTIAVIIKGETWTTGQGLSKQKAEQAAAKLALEKLSK